MLSVLCTLPDVSELRQNLKVTGASWLRACPRLRLNWLLQPLFPGLIGEGEGKGGARGEDAELWVQAKGNKADCENDELGVVCVCVSHRKRETRVRRKA